ncbi:hypothetical protein [Planomicrobium sp. YIM 101495]|uniref:hypothetical protein n=1 Tax=Planomicrobium sp. YIM 101495 TaxID=2665160 RepID=UPI001E5587E8|nr:hypothetical protein [Planomicrobium sp. YIM 101495]
MGVIDNLAFLWIEKDKSWLGLWDTEKAEVEYHPSIRHIAFEVSIEGLKHTVEWLKNRGYEPRKAFGFEPTELFLCRTVILHMPKFISMNHMAIVWNLSVNWKTLKCTITKGNN